MQLYQGIGLRKTQFGRELLGAIKLLNDLIGCKSDTDGVVISIEGGWGSGKTSFLNILLNEINLSDEAVTQFDSLYYGNASEATEVFISNIFEEVRMRFGRRLYGGRIIAQNLSPSVELSNGLPKFKFSVSFARESTEKILNGGLKEKLKGLGGKVVVTIDDIDRLPPDDVIHFLRIVRILREMPNFIVIVPFDRNALEEILSRKMIREPKHYLDKIIDRSFSTEPETSSSKDLFAYLLERKYGTGLISEYVQDRLWNVYLWEVSLYVIERHQKDVALNVGSDIHELSVPASLRSRDGHSLVKAFFERIDDRLDGRALNCAFRFIRSRSKEEEVYLSSSKLNGVTMTKLIRGDFRDAYLGPEYKPADPFYRHNGVFSVQYWRPSISELNFEWSVDRHEHVIAVEASDKVTKEKLRLEGNFFWNAIEDLAAKYLPREAYDFLLPRKLNKLVQDLRVDFRNYKDAHSIEQCFGLDNAIKKIVEKDVAS